MKRIAVVAGGGLLALAVFFIRKVCEGYQEQQDYAAHRQCVLDMQLVGGTILSEQKPNFETKTESEDIVIIGTRHASEERKGWFDYHLSILLEGGIRAASLQGSVITLRDANGTWLGKMELVALEEWALDGTITLPDPEVHFTLTQGIADGTIVFSHRS